MAIVNGYYPGQQIILGGVFRTTASSLIDPTTVTLLYKTALGTVTVVTTTGLTNASTGDYAYLVTPSSSEVGIWQWGMRGTGAAVAANLSGQFRVLEPEVST